MGTYFIDLAKKDMERFFVTLPDRDLAYFPEHTEHFNDYVEAVERAQDFARANRDLMMHQIVNAVRSSGLVPEFTAELKSTNCHHNYVARESHFGQNVLITRKGAVRAREGDMGIIPGSMGARCYIVRGKGNMPRASTAAVTAQVVRCLVMRRKSASLKEWNVVRTQM
jgi:tRNA-splicing ligase RtcB